jgi:hypothetical protein
MIPNNRILELLKESGFVFWQNESWGPGAGRVDWSNDYDREIWDFVKLLTDEHRQTLIDNGFDDAAEYL